jgi:hypothetical protein
MRYFLIIFLLICDLLFETAVKAQSPKIFDAVKNNDLKELKSLFQQGADPNSS